MSGMLIRWNILNIFQNRKPCVFPVPEGHIWCGANNLLFRRSGGVLADSPGRQATNAEFQRFARISRIFYYIILLHDILLLSISLFPQGSASAHSPFITLSNWTKIIRLTSEGFKFALRVSDVPYSFANVNKKCIAVPGLVENKDPKT
jgi:hypothetical protein